VGQPCRGADRKGHLSPTRRLAAALGAALAAALVLGAPVSGVAAPAGAPAARPAHYPWAERIQDAERYAERRAGKVSFAVVDEDGRLRGEHVDRVHYSASVVKAMFLVAYLRQGDVRDRGLDRSDKSLLGPMIKRSDNDAATAVYNDVGDGALYELAKDAEMKRFRPDATWGLSEITASDQARFFSRIESFVPRRHRHYAMRLLKEIVPSQRWGIAPVLPEGWTIHFKGGWSPGDDPGWRVNQVALLRNPPRRISLAILTRHDPGYGYGTDTIEGVAKRLLRHYNRYGR
jgi:hypothetical protein